VPRHKRRHDVIRVGVFGLGTIGRHVCRALDAGIKGLSLSGVATRDQSKAEQFVGSLTSKAPLYPTAELIASSDLIVEAATQTALRELAPQVLNAGKDLMVLSCGALLDKPEWVDLAERKRCRILVPSGGIAGLDAVKAARVGDVTRVVIESRKTPEKWAGAPYIEEHAIDLGAITTETVLFKGSATEACLAFPANLNIVAALSLSGIGPQRTSVTIFAVPGLERNAHRITVDGEFGSLQLSIENIPSENPRTAKISYFSAIAMLRQLGATLRVGT
jgi:aspartate dehydrogenase